MDKTYKVIKNGSYYKVEVTISECLTREYSFEAVSSEDAINKAKEAEYILESEDSIFNSYITYNVDNKIFIRDNKGNLYNLFIAMSDFDANVDKLKFLACVKIKVKVMLVTNKKCLVSTMPVTLGSMLLFDYKIVK